MKKLWMLMLIAGASFGKGDGPGNNGDPSQFQIYRRAYYGLLQVTEKKALPPKAIAILRDAVNGLVVEPDSSIATMGEVKEDPKRNGKRVVFVHPEKFKADLAQRYTLDLTQTALHEVYQTVLDPHGVAYDLNEEFTKNLKFDEKHFEAWLAQYDVLVDSSDSSPRLIAGAYQTVHGSHNGYWSEPIWIAHDEQWGTYSISSPLRRKIHNYMLRTGSSSEEILLTTARLPNQKWIFKPHERVFYKHNGSFCSFEYFFEVMPLPDGFYLRERYPSDSRATSPCTLDGYDWRRHPAAYELHPGFYVRAYEAALEDTSDPKRKDEFRLFIAAIQNNGPRVKELLASGVNQLARDWRDRTPLMMAARYAANDVVDIVLPTSDLTLEAEAKRDVYYYAAEGVGSAANKEVLLRKLLAHQKTKRGVNTAFVWASANPEGFKLFEALIAEKPDANYVGNAIGILIDQTTIVHPESEVDRLLKLVYRSGLAKELTYNYLSPLVKNNNGPLFFALVEAGANIHAVNYFEGGNLMLAAEFNRVEMAKRMIAEYKVDANLLDRKSMTALAYALNANAVEMINLLIPVTDLSLKVGDKRAPHAVFAASLIGKKDYAMGQVILDMVNVENSKVDLSATDLDGYTAADRVTEAYRERTHNYRRFNSSDRWEAYLQVIANWIVTTLKAPLNKEKPMPPNPFTSAVAPGAGTVMHPPAYGGPSRAFRRR